MQIFVTGSTGWVGSAVIQQLKQRGHSVRGLVRQTQQETTLEAQGVTPVRGTLDAVETLREEAERADVVIHTAFNHDFSKFLENAAQDRRAIEALGKGLRRGTGRLVATSGMVGLAQGRAAVETDTAPASGGRQSEAAVIALRKIGHHASIIRLPPSVHGIGDHAFVPFLIHLAKRTGVAAYVGDGSNRWSGVHRHDAARLFCLVAEQSEPAAAYHAVEAQSLTFKQLAETIGKKLGVLAQARPKEHFEWMALFAAMDAYGSSEGTQRLTGWQAKGPTLLDDLEQDAYFAGA